MTQAEDLLRQLGAREGNRLTPVGQAMARLPVHPRLARLLLTGQRLGVPDRAALAAALLSERDPFVREQHDFRRGPRQAQHRSESDLVDRIAALEDFERAGVASSIVGRLNPGSAKFLLRARDQLLRLLRDETVAAASPDNPASVGKKRISSVEALQQAVLEAFPDRVARRRESTGDVPNRRGVMVGGRGVRLWEASAVSDAELFVCVDVDAGAGEALVRQASSVSREWLAPELLQVQIEVEFDTKTERVGAVRRTRWNGLVLDETPAPLPEDDHVAEVLAEAAAGQLDKVMPRDHAELINYLARVNSLRKWMPDLQLPALDDDQLRKLLPEVCRGCRSFTEVRRGEWLHAVKGLLTYQQQQIVEREAPERIDVPSGNRITLQYETGRSPVLAVRIQEMFGLAETPRIAGGRVPVLLHLLSPNMRPQQVTDDLKSFWNNAYQQVRKELRRRYPKHAWPEDPWQAEPERRPRRKS